MAWRASSLNERYGLRLGIAHSCDRWEGMPRPAAGRPQCRGGHRHPQDLPPGAGPARAVILRVESRPAPGLLRAAAEDEPDGALALPFPRSEEFQHPLIVDAFARECEADLVRQVEVAGADGIGVAECADP